MARFSPRLLLALFLFMPLLEIYLLIQVGGLIGALPTMLLIVVAALLGVMLLRLQGMATLARAQAALARGELPARAMLEGVVAVVGALLLVIPGLFTDLLALLCLIPPLRRLLLRWVMRRGVIQSPGMGGGPHDQGPRTLEGEYWQDDERH